MLTVAFIDSVWYATKVYFWTSFFFDIFFNDLFSCLTKSRLHDCIDDNLIAETWDHSPPEAVAQKCSDKKVFLKLSQNSQENTTARVSF